MKLGKTLLVGLATISLVACSNNYGKEVKEEEFQAAAKEVEPASYSKAVLSYKVYSKVSVTGMETETTDIKGEIKYSKDEGGAFVPDSGQNIPEELEDYEDVVGMDIAVAIDGMKANASESFKFQYFTSPLGVLATMNLELNEDGVKSSTKISSYIQFNNNGLMAKETFELTSKASAKEYSSNSVEKMEINVSYQ